MTLERQLYRITRGKDSPLELPVTVDGQLVDSDGITRCDLVFRRQGVADLKIDSATNPTWFTLQKAETIDGLSINIVYANLRQVADPPANGIYAVDVYLYDADFANGRLWGTIDAEVRAATP